MKIIRSLVSALGIVFITGSVAAPQAPATGQPAGAKPPAPMKNLQVLPKDTPQPQVVAIMRVFNAALAVNCDHCHAWVKPGDPTNDMASDAKTPKLVAREMMRMTTEINTKLAGSIKKPADQIAKVECATCHRGAAIPVSPPPPPPAVPAATPPK